METKTRIRIVQFGLRERKGLYRIFISAVSLLFLCLFLWGLWEIDGVAITLGIDDVYEENNGDDDQSLPIRENESENSWIIYESDLTEEFFTDTDVKDGALKMLATTVRPYSWMEQFNGIAVNNESERVVNIEQTLLRKSSIEVTKDGSPQVLIVHTHGTESYNEGSLFKYYESDYLRSTNIEENVVAIGARIKEILTEAGYSVIHDMTMHDDGNYNGSYASSRKAIKKYLEEYPSIKIVLDVHRDTVITQEGVKYRTIWEYHGKSAAQVMILLGAGGSKYPNDHWEENLGLSLMIYERAVKKYPDLMRPILMRSSLYNQDLSNGGILVEVGTCGNTFEEAILGAECFTDCLVDVMNSLCKGE